MSGDGTPGGARRRGRLLVILPLAVFAGLAAAFYWGLWNNDDRLPSPLVGKAIPEFELPPIEGRDVGLSSADLRGQVSIVNVWASWCVPCRVEMPLLMELAEDGQAMAGRQPAFERIGFAHLPAIDIQTAGRELDLDPIER